MGNTSNESKKRWNDVHYSQVKVSIKQEIAAQFKAKCAAANTSMASEISRFMSGHSPKKPEPSVTTRQQRRRALSKAILLLETIADAEQAYRDNIPINLQNSQRYEAAEEASSMLEEALNILYGVYMD